MNAAIPCDVDEANELVVVVGADMGEAAEQGWGEVARGRGATGGGPEGVKFGGGGKGSMRSSGILGFKQPSCTGS